MADASIQGAMGGAEALLSSMIPQKEMVKTDMYSGVPQSFTEGRNFAKDIFKEKAVSSVQTDDLDRQLMNLRAKKSSLFADVVKDNKARGITMKPSEVRSFVNKFSNEIDNQASTLLTEKKSRIDTAQQLSEADYEVKSKQFLDNRSRQMELDRQIADETVKPQSDPNKITELMKQKGEVDKQMDKLGKEFKARGIDQPEVILREESNKQIQAPAEQVAPVGADTVLYNAGMGNYDDANGAFQPKSFMADLQKLPDFAGLPKKAMAEKLLALDADIQTLEDMFYVANSIQDTPDAMVDVLKEKGLDDDTIAQIVLNGYIKNDNDGDIIKQLATSLYNAGISKDTIKTIIENYGLEVSKDFTVQESK